MAERSVESSISGEPASQRRGQELGAIRAVTYGVPDLGAVEHAYVDQLGYTVAARGEVGARLAEAWGAADAAGLPMSLLVPASGEAVFLRFIEDPRAGDWSALTTYGWNATEFVVQDVDALARRLERSAFQIIGPPKGLTRFPMIRAMQAIGPAGECCYFTEVGPGSGLSLAAAQSFVGRVFIAVAAGPDVDALFVPYREFTNAVDPPVATPVAVISKAHGLPPETLHRHGLVRLPRGTLIELDQYPRTARARPCTPGRLPPGMAMVSFDVGSLAGRTGVTPLALGDLPRVKGCCACLRGAAGELIELVAPPTI